MSTTGNRLCACILLAAFVGCSNGSSGVGKVEPTDNKGGNPAADEPRIDIWQAAAEGDIEAVRQHLAARTELNGKEPIGGSTPLILASVFGQPEAARVLIEAGAELETKNNESTTALYNAAFFGHTEIVKVLLDNGADASTKSKEGLTPREVAELPWDAVEGIYKAVVPALGIQRDLEEIKAARPEVAQVLREHAQRYVDEPSPNTAPPRIPIGKGEEQPAVTAADWATYNYNAAGWRFNPAENTLSPDNVGELVEKWRFPAADSEQTIGVVHATPTVVAGEVYFGTATFPAFHKLASDGTLRWVYRNPAIETSLPPNAGASVDAKLGVAAGDGGIFSSALVVGDSVYFADTGGWMYCLDRATGAERWKVNSRAAPFPDPHFFNVVMASPIMADGKVVFAGGTLEQLIAGTDGYPGCTGRGFLVALDPGTGAVSWKYDVGPKPEKLEPPVVIKGSWGEYKFTHGPATSSVWCTPSYDAESNTLFFGTDVNTAPRQPTPDNPQLHTEDSCAIAAIDAATGERKWNTQINPGDVWTNSQRAWDPETGLYKDASIGDTPKIFTIEIDGQATKVVGAGCKNGGFYVLRADNGMIVGHTPLYTGPPTHPPQDHDPRVLALPSPVGGLQSGCATDGHTLFTNGIDALRLGTQARPDAPGQLPTAGRVTATSVDLGTELWRHERPVIPEIRGASGKPVYRNVGDAVASGIALGNGVAYFTTVGSGKLVAVDAETGSVLKEIDLGPVFAGPSLSRGRIYVGGGNTLFTPSESEAFFPKQYIGSVRCFGAPDG